jgi:hypothetical protein
MQYSKAIDCGDVIYVIDYESSKEMKKLEHEDKPIQAALTNFNRLFIKNFLESRNIFLYQVILHPDKKESKLVISHFLKEISNAGYQKLLVIVEPSQDENSILTYILTDRAIIKQWDNITRKTEGFFNGNVTISRNQQKNQKFHLDQCSALEECLNIILNIGKRNHSLNYKDIIKYRGLEQCTTYPSSETNRFVKEKGLLHYEKQEHFSKYDKKIRNELTVHVYTNSSRIQMFFMKDNELKIVDRFNNSFPTDSSEIFVLC